MIGLIGRKIGMTQLFTEKGRLVPVTVVEAGPCRVLQVRTPEKEGYEAVQLGFGEIREKLLNKPRRGHLTRCGSGPLRLLREFRAPGGHGYKTGDQVTVQEIEVGARVDVVGTSKGKGFQGVVKRHHFHGGPASHGSKTGNLPGSIGTSAWPSHVLKGRRLPGHMGDARCTARNLRVVKVDTDRNLVLVEGSIPGANGNFVLIRPAGLGRQGVGWKTGLPGAGKAEEKKGK
jgi:large subunit ribosomal protein L3